MSLQYGDFVDAMDKAAKSSGIEVQTFFKAWHNILDPEQWKEFRLIPVSKELALAFVHDMAFCFRETLADTCTDELYEMLLDEWHSFAEKIHQECRDLGLGITFQEIKLPVTPSQTMLALQRRALESPERMN